jgi:crotonobetainyl-CoA:carnitine CoA-transferase CaiB-like acyl-CoA transferase
MSDELDTRVEILTALFNSGDGPERQPKDAGAQFYALIKTWERKDVEIAFCRVMRILAATARTPTAPAPTGPPTANSTLEAMGTIMADLTSGRITAADAKARLYAHQIALSALRTIDNAKARRQKEERLRRTTASPNSQRTQPATASPRRKSTSRKNHQRRNRPVLSASRRTKKNSRRPSPRTKA